MKKLLIAIPIILLFLASGCIIGKATDTSNLPELNFTTGLAYQYNPSGYLPDWQLPFESERLGRMSTAVQDELTKQNIVDAAAWEFQRGDEKMYVWAKVYDSAEDAINASQPFTSPMAWHGEKVYLAFADEGAIGIFDNLRDKPPLFIYAVKDNVLIHIAYYNKNEIYKADSETKDQLFLINLLRDMLNK